MFSSKAPFGVSRAEELIAQRGASRQNWIWRFAYPFFALLVVWLAWEIVSYSRLLDTTIFPPPSQFLTYLWREDFSIGIGPEPMSILGAVVATLGRALAGLVIGIIVALTLGLSISLSEIPSRLIMPLVQFAAPIAPIAWLPLGILLFGIGDNTAVFIVFMGTVFILTIATVAAVQNVDQDLLKVSASLGAKRWQQWRHVILPAILPQVFTFVRINFFAAWMAVLAAEMVGIKNGLGAMIMIGRESANFNLILIGMFLIGACGWLIDTCLALIQGKLFWWRAWGQD